MTTARESGDSASPSNDSLRTQCFFSRSHSICQPITMLELTFLGSECVTPAYLYWLSLDYYRLLRRNPPSGINQKLARV